jgi:hypothetical protein
MQATASDEQDIATVSHTELTRLLAKTRRNGECMEWTGTLHSKKNPYGIAWDKARYQRRLAHRVSYELANGVSLTPAQFVCHACDNPPCVNPAHLWLGDHLSNARDRKAKGRPAGGGTTGNPKLSAEQVADIRERHSRPSHNVSNTKELAAEYGVAIESIQNIIAGRTWSGR